MLLKVCSVWSARSSLTTLPVFGSKPPWPDRKIHFTHGQPRRIRPGGGNLGGANRSFHDVPSSTCGNSVMFPAVYIPIGVLYE
jgi:hypothetical protein